MSAINLRSGASGPLTHAQVDQNFTNLNNDKAGYVSGEGGADTQNTSKSTGVTINKKCGAITLHNESMSADEIKSFALTNSEVGANDIVVLNHASAGTAGKYALNAQASAGSVSINVTNISAGALSEAIVIRFAVIKVVVA